MRRAAMWGGAMVLLAALVVAAVAWGTVPLAPRAVALAVLGRGDPGTVAIVRALRLPRVALALLVGAGLGMSGAALQGSLRNALAEPYLLGVSGGAAVGAVVAVALGIDGAGVLPLFAFAGAALAIVTAILVARAAGGRADPRVLLMAGVIIGAFANAAIMVVLAGASPNTVRGALWWMMGSAAGADWAQVAWLAGYTALAGGALLWMARDIDVLSLGEEAAAALGVHVERSARRVYLVSSLLAAATVAAAGLVGFVGLVVPHLVRGAGVRRHRPLLAGAALAGAALVVAADLLARVAHPPAELPLGAVTAIVGVPFFLAQLRRLS
ncbi:MAG TPA: iron ABC transporter permease [Gemmatimonadaceae bacterium]|nr:iron ABC transporter permease [Gemmatimonadaceae bacterium]